MPPQQTLAKSYQILAWDSEFLGFKVASLPPTTLTASALADLLNDLHDQQAVQLVYWAPFAQDNIAAEAATKQQAGYLTDRKITYRLDCQQQTMPPPVSSAIAVYPMVPANDALLALAIESGRYSRFRQDPRLSPATADAIYQAWIQNATQHHLADEVFVYYQDKRIVGLITLGEKNQRADIGLLAVNGNYRRQAIGTQLIQAALAWAIQQSYTTIQVVTQAINLPACRLYTACGFQIDTIQHMYHFWLGNNNSKKFPC